jgi:hypothetical protein
VINDNNEKSDTNLSNPERRTAFACSGIIILGIVMIFLPGILGMDGFNGGFALAFLGGFVCIIGIICVFVFARLARLFDSIMKKENILVHWTYSQDDWKRYTEEEHKEDARNKRNLFLLVAAISVVVGIIMWAMHPDDAGVIIIIILGIIAVIGLTAFLSILSPYRWNKKHLGDVYITRDGAYLNRRLHVWKGLGTKLEGVTFEAGKQSLPRINIEYSSINTTMRNYYTARIPVPLGQEEVAQNIVEQIQDSQKHK